MRGAECGGKRKIAGIIGEDNMPHYLGLTAIEDTGTSRSDSHFPKPGQ